MMKLILRVILVFLLAVGVLHILFFNDPANIGDPAKSPIVGERILEFYDPPYVPSLGSDDQNSTLVIMDMQIVERNGELANGADKIFWTLDNRTPGSFIRVRQGDSLVVHLKNAAHNRFAHNIDLHAANCPRGGAISNFVAPGQETVASFRAINPGLFIYHGSAAPVEMFMETGFYGLVLVEPRKGSSQVDREYYLMHGIEANEQFKNELIAEPGETIRLFIGNTDPIPISCDRIIQNEFKNFRAAYDRPTDQEMHARTIPSGGTAIVEFKVKASNKYSIRSAVVYELEEEFGEEIADLGAGTDGRLTFDQKLEMGEVIYQKLCKRCHMGNGEGLEAVYPPLHASDHFADDLYKAIDPVANGMQGPIVVNGMDFNGIMPKFRLSNRQVAAVVTFVANNFENPGGEVTVEMVEQVCK